MHSAIEQLAKGLSKILNEEDIALLLWHICDSGNWYFDPDPENGDCNAKAASDKQITCIEKFTDALAKYNPKAWELMERDGPFQAVPVNKLRNNCTVNS